MAPTDAQPEPDDDDSEFDEAQALAVLLSAEAVFLNDHWWRKDWPEDARAMVSVNANCNDVFAWGCADAEEVPYRELQSLHEHHVKDPLWGVSVWCMRRRKELPQKPVADRIAKAGIWDLDAVRQEVGLRANHYDGVSHVLAQRKYSAYCEWAASVGQSPLPWDARWWGGWNEYTAANPDWFSPEWEAADDRARSDWRIANGFEEPAASAAERSDFSDATGEFAMNHPHPWTSLPPKTCGAIDIVDARGDYVATVGPLSDDAETARVAAIVGAAGELLGALRLMLSAWEGFSTNELQRRHLMGDIDTPTLGNILAARAAIARAEGG